MSTKAVKSQSYYMFGNMRPCAWCGARFNDAKVFKTNRPREVCPWCWHRGDPAGELRRKFRTMQKALDGIANVACVKDGADECACPTCFAGKVYDDLFNPKESNGESGNDGDGVGSTGSSDPVGTAHEGDSVGDSGGSGEQGVHESGSQDVSPVGSG